MVQARLGQRHLAHRRRGQRKGERITVFLERLLGTPPQEDRAISGRERIGTVEEGRTSACEARAPGRSALQAVSTMIHSSVDDYRALRCPDNGWASAVSWALAYWASALSAFCWATRVESARRWRRWSWPWWSWVKS